MQPCTHPVIQKVHASLALKGTRLAIVCRENGIDSGNIYRFLRGEVKSDKAIKERDLVLKVAEVELNDNSN